MVEQLHDQVRDQSLERLILPFEDGTFIVSYVRHFARDLIAYCKELVGPKNLAILTMASADYGIACIAAAKFDIDPDRIYTREDLHMNVPMFKDSNNILIDNENHRYHSIGKVNKVKFLHGLPVNKLVQVRTFLAKGKDVATVLYFEDLKVRINEAIKN